MNDIRIKLNLTGKTYHIRELIKYCGYEWDGRSWNRNILSKGLDEEIKLLKQVGITCYHGSFPMGCNLTVYPLSAKDFEGKEFTKVMDKVKKSSKGKDFCRDDHLTMQRFYEGYEGFDKIIPLLEVRENLEEGSLKNFYDNVCLHTIFAEIPFEDGDNE